MTDRQIDRQTDRQTDRKTERQKDRKTERQKDRKTERQTDRITIPGHKYILTCLVQGGKNDSPIELGD
jgi:hypothetical protein